MEETVHPASQCLPDLLVAFLLGDVTGQVILLDIARQQVFIHDTLVGHPFHGHHRVTMVALGLVDVLVPVGFGSPGYAE